MPNFSFLGCLEVAVLWLEDNKNKNNNLVELVASLAPAKAEVGAVAKADQHILNFYVCLWELLAVESPQSDPSVLSKTSKNHQIK